MVGMHKRMGVEVRQDKAENLEVVYRLMEGIEKEFSASETNVEREYFSDISVCILASFLTAIRGGDFEHKSWGND